MKKLYYSLFFTWLLASCGGTTQENREDTELNRPGSSAETEEYDPDSLPANDLRVPADGTETQQDSL